MEQFLQSVTQPAKNCTSASNNTFVDIATTKTTTTTRTNLTTTITPSQAMIQCPPHDYKWNDPNLMRLLGKVRSPYFMTIFGLKPPECRREDGYTFLENGTIRINPAFNTTVGLQCVAKCAHRASNIKVRLGPTCRVGDNCMEFACDFVLVNCDVNGTSVHMDLYYNSRSHMELYFAEGGLDANPRWTCRYINLTYDQLQARHKKYPIVGTIYILAGCFFQVLYLLALSVIGTKDLLKHSCYKIMLCLGLFDFACMIFSAQVSGYFYLVGAEYCMYPHFQYIIGTLIMGCFCPVCTLSLVLVMNRLIDSWRPDISKKLFHGNKTWFWCLLCTLYGVACFWKAPSMAFNVDIGTWIFNPLIPGNTYTDYSPMWLGVNNLITSSGLCSSYVGFVVIQAYKMRATRAVESTTLQSNILRQAICICFFTSIATTIWASMIFYEPGLFLLHLGQLCWHLMHAVPSLVYLLLNKTIQTRALSNLRKCTGIRSKISYATLRLQKRQRDTQVVV